MATLQESGLDRYRSAFDKLDVNNDGYVDESDIEQAVDDMVRASGRDLKSPEAANFHHQYIQLHRLYTEKIDTNHDNRISKDEFLAGAKALYGNPAIVARIISYFVAVFNLVDVDSDGELSLDEYAKLVRTTGYTEQQVEEEFRALNKDRNGSLSLPEMLAHAASHFGSC